jgi:hypothetical protein
MGGNERLRSWFLRNFLEAAERELGAPAIAALPARAPNRVRAHLSLDRLKASAALDSIPLDEGEEALVAFDQVLGDGSGKLIERVSCEMLARQLVQAVAAVRVGDLFGTVARLQGPLEHPFMNTTLTFDLLRTGNGLTLIVGVLGRPRASRLLGHLATGAVLAAERFAREAHAAPLKVETEAFADRSRIDARFRRASSAPPPPIVDIAPFSRRSSGAGRLSGSLSEEVNRILDRAPRRDSTPPGPDTSASSASFPSETPTLRRDAAPLPREESARALGPGSVPPPPRPRSEPPPRSSAPPPRRDSAPPSRRESTPPPSELAPVTAVGRVPTYKPR